MAQPDIEVLDTVGNPVPNPTYNPTQRVNNIIRVTVRNRGTQTARNTEAYLYWADPATNIPYSGAWQTTGIYTGGMAAGFPSQSNVILIRARRRGVDSARLRMGPARRGKQYQGR